MKFVKGKRAPEPVTAAPTPRAPKKANPNPWIDRRYFDVMQARCVAAENMCKDLIHVITGDGGKALAKHDFDYLAAGEAIKRKKGRV